MKEAEVIKTKISKIIAGLRTVLRQKTTTLALLISMGNGFLGLNFHITSNITEYDNKKNNSTTIEQQKKYEEKFKNSKAHLDKILDLLEKINSAKIEKTPQDIKSFHDIPKAIDSKLENIESSIQHFISITPKKFRKNTYELVNHELDQLIKQ